MDSSDSDSYAGSAASVAAIRDSDGAQIVDAVASAYDPLPLDRPVVVEAQHSGLLNAVTKDLAALRSEADELAAATAADTARMQSLLKKTQANLEWLAAHVARLEDKVKGDSPIEYAQARDKIVYRE